MTLAHADPPQLYAQSLYQGLVRGEPDDLLLLAGEGLAADDEVVYAAVDDTTQPPTPPSEVPTIASSRVGRAPIVARAPPRSLTVRLPQVLRPRQSYALWIRTARGEWSAPALINDARPVWLSPAVVNARSDPARLERQLKIIGRNLAPATDAAIRVRLTGPETLTLMANAEDDAAMASHVARVTLPPLAAGEYRVAVSRDGRSWVSLVGQSLIVRAEPQTPETASVSSAENGGCVADDHRDDTACIAAAISRVAHHGGVVVLGPGEWNLSDSAVAPRSGLLLERGVSLRGGGRDATTLVRSAEWGGKAMPTFTLLGDNQVTGIRFVDTRAFVTRDVDVRRAALQLGRSQDRGTARPRIEDVLISDNAFDAVHTAIADVGLPLARITLTHNDFNAWFAALELTGDRFNMTQPFAIEDAVIAHNTFLPGGYVDPAAGQGTLATELGASRRVDFSDNVANGSARERAGSRGWRAAFFWHMNNSHEMLLVSENTATCTGDLLGDGEAIAYDNNANTFGFAEAQRVLAATTDTVTVAGPLLSRQNNRDVDIARYYREHWVQIADGRGVGQVRRIASYAIDSRTGQVRVVVAPAWDVAPAAGVSRIVVAREFWQVYTLANQIDHRSPLCAKSNRDRERGGGIVLWAQMADSVVAGNRQYDTDGIVLHQSYSAVDPACRECVSSTFLQSALDVRDNTIDGEYRWASACSVSGISLSYSASPTPRSPPPRVGFGINIAHNAIAHADGLGGGGISAALTWYDGPPPYRWPLIDGLLIQHNAIRDIEGAPPLRGSCRFPPGERVGVRLQGRFALASTVLYANSCTRVRRGVAADNPSTVLASTEQVAEAKRGCGVE
jgi:hypothetical protein